MTKKTELKKLIKEPLLHFLLIGAALFLIFDWKGGPSSLPGGAGNPEAQINIGREAVDRVLSQFERTWQRQPTEEERKGLIEDLVRSEIYYREAIANGLDRDDEVLKRRLRQKMEFIFEDMSSWAEPTDESLKAFMREHREKYLVDPQVAFQQVYINTGARGAGAEADARNVLAQLKNGADPATAGDPTMLEAEVPLLPLWDIRKQFGDEFGRNVLDIKPGHWAGPIRSGYGLHLVFVLKRVAGRLPELNKVRDAVKRDWMAEYQRELKDKAYAKIRERYVVTVEMPKPADAPLTAEVTTKVKMRDTDR